MLMKIGFTFAATNRAHGEVGPPKTKERMAPVPIIDQVRVPLELWRAKCEDTATEAWIITDLPNMMNRVIKPHVMGEKECDRCEKTPKTSGVRWKGLYAGRRGACTAIIEATNGKLTLLLKPCCGTRRWTQHCVCTKKRSHKALFRLK